jgi:hypothetical protein
LQQSNVKPTKPPQTSGSGHLDDAPLHIPSSKKEQKKEKLAEKRNLDIEKKEKKKKKEKNAEKISLQQQKLDEIEPPQPPPPQILSSASNAFRDLYLAQLADIFESEIESLNDADAPVGSRVLIQALESNLSLFSEQEKKVASAAEAIHTQD